jgi:hypothetical protein
MGQISSRAGLCHPCKTEASSSDGSKDGRCGCGSWAGILDIAMGLSSSHYLSGYLAHTIFLVNVDSNFASRKCERDINSWP